MQYPRVNATLTVGEGLLPGIYFDASYDKRYITSWDDFGDPENTVIGAGINYKTGNAVISLSYDLRYDPDPLPGEDPWVTTANLTTSVAF